MPAFIYSAICCVSVAWTVACRSVSRTTVVLSATSFPSGTISSTARTGARLSSCFCRRTTSPSSRVACVRRRAKAHACSASTNLPSPSRTLRTRLSTMPLNRAGSSHNRPNTAPERAWQLSEVDLLVSLRLRSLIKYDVIFSLF